MECLQTLAGHTGPVRTLVYSGGHMFSGSYDKTVSCAGGVTCSLCVSCADGELFRRCSLCCRPIKAGILRRQELFDHICILVGFAVLVK